MHGNWEIFLSLTYLLFQVLQITLSHNGSPCNLDDDCDPRTFLQCNKNFYVCYCPKPLIWDKTRQQCRIREGSPCKFEHQLDPSSDAKNICVTNTTCASGTCRCAEGFLRDGFGTCGLSYGQSCTSSTNASTEQCAGRYMLQCYGPTSTCRCVGEDKYEFVWDEVRQKCVRPVSSTCDMDKSRDNSLDCVENAVCSPSKGSTTGRGICVCQAGYSVTPDYQCLLDYNEKCDNADNRSCNKHRHLNCGSNGRCDCEFYGQMIFHSQEKECLMLAGEFCDLEGSGRTRRYRCIPGAECVVHLQQTLHKGRCECVSGLFKESNGTCSKLRLHGMSCSYAGDCNQAEFLTCVIENDREGLCGCIPNEMYYDPIMSSCVVYPGRSCLDNKKCGYNSYCKNNEYCSCYDGFVLDSINKKCIKVPVIAQETEPASNPSQFNEHEVDHRQAVSPKGPFLNQGVSEPPCSLYPPKSVDFAKCSCNSQPDMTWSVKNRRCVGRVGSKCEVDQACSDFAYCNYEVNTCQCDDRIAWTTTNRTCSLHPDSNNFPLYSNSHETEFDGSRTDHKKRPEVLPLPTITAKSSSSPSPFPASGNVMWWATLISLKCIPFL